MAQNRIDHRIAINKSGLYSEPDALPISLGLLALSGALYEGSESRLGRTFWQSGEAMLGAEVAAQVLKRVTRREPPGSTSNPGHWFGDRSWRSFPSGHVSMTTAAVTPYILEYRRDQPWVQAMALLPVFEMVARVKGRDHWQTDVLAGAALGAAVGYVEHQHKSAWVLSLLPGGVFVGLRVPVR